MGLIPGFPTMVFLFLGVMLGITGMALRKVQHQMEFSDAEITTVIGQQEAGNAAQLGGGDIKAALEDMQPLSPALVELPEQAKTLFSLDTLNLEFVRIRREFYQDMGVPLPGISVRLSSRLSNDNYQISIRGVPVAQGNLQPARPAIQAESPKPVQTKREAKWSQVAHALLPITFRPSAFISLTFCASTRLNLSAYKKYTRSTANWNNPVTPNWSGKCNVLLPPPKPSTYSAAC